MCYVTLIHLGDCSCADIELYTTCILPIFPYDSECWAVTKRDVLKIDAHSQWCLWKLLGIIDRHNVWNDEVRRTAGQPHLSAIVQAPCFSLFGHIMRMHQFHCLVVPGPDCLYGNWNGDVAVGQLPVFGFLVTVRLVSCQPCCARSA